MLDQFIGIVKIFAGSYAPEGWALCNGQLLQISNYQALYTIIGTTYGGDGVTNFALPNLNGRVPVGAGPSHPQGRATGSELTTITPAQLPSHSHVFSALSGNREKAEPTNNFLATTTGLFYGQVNPGDQLLPMNAKVVSVAAGGSQPHNNMSPYLAINYVIALEGIYPTRG